jgi:iron complex transport system ATP-binding protein
VTVPTAPATAPATSNTPAHTLEAHSVSVAYGDRTVVAGVELRVPVARISVIVGANASGKSTLLKALARLLTPKSGTVLLDGVDIHSQPSRRVARVLGLLPQNPIAPDGIAVAELVGRGRYPHQSLLRRWSATDDAAVASALELTSATDLADRSIDELSGGQRQRVWIAMALAQETEVLLLDEPTTFLDVTHQIEVLDLLTDLNRTRGTTIVVVLHDLNLAARYADHLFAMRAGRLVASGPPREIITEQLVREVFDLDSRVIEDPTTGAPLVLPKGRHHVR